MLLAVPSQLKENTRLWEFYTCFGYETKRGVVRVLVIFHGRPMLSHISEKLSPRPFK